MSNPQRDREIQRINELKRIAHKLDFWPRQEDVTLLLGELARKDEELNEVKAQLHNIILRRNSGSPDHSRLIG